MPRDAQTENQPASGKKPLPSDVEEWWRDWYEIEKKPNPIVEKADKKGNLSLAWEGPQDAPGLIGYPWVINTPIYSMDEKNVLDTRLLPAEGLFPFKLRVVAKAEAYHCIVVVREDVYETA